MPPQGGFVGGGASATRTERAVDNFIDDVGRRPPRTNIRDFFQKKIRDNRARNRSDEIREERRARNEAARREIIWAQEFGDQLLDEALFEGDVQYNIEDEFAHDAMNWLEMARNERDFIPDRPGGTKRYGDTLEQERGERRRMDRWLDQHTAVREPIRYLGYLPNPIGVGDSVFSNAAVAEGVNIPGVNIPMVYDGQPVGGPPLPPDTGSVEMVEIEVNQDMGPYGPVVDVVIPHPDGGETVIAVNPFSPEELAATLEKTRESPFVVRKKKKYKPVR